MADCETMPLTLRMFGPLEVRLGSTPLPSLHSRKGQWLLVLLVLRHDTDVARSWLAGLLWPGRPEAVARAGLRNALANLRQALGPAAAHLSSPTADTLRLEMAGVEADAVAFDAAIARGDLPSLQAAVDLYRGPFLEGCVEEWVLPEREAREHAFLGALEQLAAAASASGDFATAERYLRRAGAVDPTRETVQRALMETLARSGNHPAALRAYRDLCDCLQRDLQAEPEPETRALFAAIRDEARRRGAEERARGETRPIVRRPHAATAARYPPSVAPSPPTHNLPHPVTSFVGRERELAEIRALLGKTRLLTLTGTGGIGKTRLALQVAAPLPAAMRDGVWFIDLAPLADAALVPQAVATVLGVREQRDVPLVRTLAETLRSWQSLLLLDNCEHLVAACAALAETLLRGCPEVVLLATSREALNIAGETIFRLPSLSLPDPSRWSMVDGQWSKTDSLSELPQPSTISHQPSTLVQSDAVRLFLERAAAALPSFAVTEENAGAVAGICRRLDGIPLALELAAAHVRSLTVTALAARLDDRFRLLARGSRTALPRQQTLRASIDWSYDLLTQAERALLRRLAVFAGGWMLEAVEAVCGEVEGGGQKAEDRGRKTEGRRQKAEGRTEEEAIPGSVEPQVGLPTADCPLPSAFCLLPSALLDLLTALVEKSLVLYEAGSGERYWLLETVREYAWERLREAGEERTVRERHRDWLVAWAMHAEGRLRGPDQIAWLDRLEAERDNLRAALEWSLAECGEAPARVDGESREGRPRADAGTLPADLEAGLRLLGALRDFWPVRGYSREAGVWLEAFLARAEQVLPDGSGTAGYAKALLMAGYLAEARSTLSEAEVAARKSVDLSRALDDGPLTAEGLNLLARLAFTNEKFDAAATLWEESLALGRATGDRMHVATALNGLGRIAFRTGEYDRAAALLDECLEVSRALGDRRLAAWALHSLGRLAANRGEYARAIARFQEARTLFQEVGDAAAVAAVLLQIGQVAARQGEYQQAVAHAEEARALYRSLGVDEPGIVREILADVARRQGDFGPVIAIHRERLTQMRDGGPHWGLAGILEGLAKVAAAQNQPARAARLFGAAASVRTTLGAARPPNDQEEYAASVTGARAALGEAAFATAWAEGEALSPAEAITWALDH